jgi:uncharacterized membrane protein
MSDTQPEHGLSIHRSEALTDGIYAVAMTLLVIELKLPDGAAMHSQAEIAAALLGLVPKFYAWVISFCVLAFFWLGHHRAYSHVRRTDGRLIALTLAQLAFVSLMPFSCALLGEHSGLLPQVIYSLNMMAMAVFSLCIWQYIHRHPELSPAPLGRGIYLGTLLRISGLIAVSMLTVVIQWWLDRNGSSESGIANTAFLLMALLAPLSRRLERASGRAAPHPARG